MKSIIILSLSVILMIFTSSCNSGNPSARVKKENLEKAKKRDFGANNAPVIKFNNTEHNFGTVTDGDIVETIFKFTNVGKSDLIITDAKTTCGCTVPSWPKDKPIKPGETSEIKVKFNTAGKGGGRQSKSITLYTNTVLGREIVKIKGIVNKKTK